jgi:hypothetical protein
MLINLEVDAQAAGDTDGSNRLDDIRAVPEGWS